MWSARKGLLPMTTARGNRVSEIVKEAKRKRFLFMSPLDTGVQPLSLFSGRQRKTSPFLFPQALNLPPFPNKIQQGCRKLTQNKRE
jgi:hypothetical protein